MAKRTNINKNSFLQVHLISKLLILFCSGLFGLNTIREDHKILVITEGEFDAMAVY